MENNESLNKNLEKLISLHGEEQKMDEDQKKRILEKLTGKDVRIQVQEKSHIRIWRKIAIAALIVLIPAVIGIYILFSSEQKVKIPPELAVMSIEQLILLNYDSSQTAFDPNIVKYALQKALENASPEEVIKFAKDLKKKGSGGFGGAGEFMQLTDMSHESARFLAADSIGYSRKPFTEVVMESNLFVQGRLVSWDLSVEDIIAALVNKERFFQLEEDFMNKYRVEVHLYVNDCLPENMLRKGKTITIPTILYEDQVNSLKKNSEYYFAMVKDGRQEPHFFEAFSGVYPVDYNKPANVELWQFFKDAQDVLLWAQTPKNETIDYWASKLEGETFDLALEYINILPDDLIPSSSLMDIIEQKYNDLLLQQQEYIDKALASDNSDTRRFANREAANLSNKDAPLFIKVMSLLLKSGDKASIKRMLSLFDEDIEFGRTSILWRRISERNNELLSVVMKMIIASAENVNAQLLIDTYEKFRSLPLIYQDYVYNNEELMRLNKILFVHELYNQIINESQNMPEQETRKLMMSILEEPSNFDFPCDYSYDDAQRLKRVWTILAKDGDYEFRSYLEDIIEEPNFDKIKIDPTSYKENTTYDFERSAFESLQYLPGSVRPSHEELIRYLLMIYSRHSDNQSCKSATVITMRDILKPTDIECIPVITEMLLGDDPQWSLPLIIKDRIPNPAFVPVIRTLIENNTFNNASQGDVIGALYACGQEEEAIDEALKVLAQPIREDDWSNIFGDGNRIAAILKFLGTTQRQELIETLEPYTTNSYFETYKPVFDKYDLGYYVSEIQQNAIMAMARLGGAKVNTKLRDIYQSTTDIRARIVSALALYYNGDKTGYELLRYFVEGTHMNVPEINMRWGVDLSDGVVFQHIINSYLRNELTDALWLEKLTYYVDRADTDIESDFFKDHRQEILNIMVEQLNNKDKETRGFACEILQKATGQSFGFDSDKYPGQQEEIIQQWREYLNSIDK